MQFKEKCRKLVRLGDKFIAKNDPVKFHMEAAQLLGKADLHTLFDFQEIVTESFKKDFSHLQNFKGSEFSDLPLTIARGEHCFIDLYFWRRRPTTIHNHHFTGAFQCLYGKNMDSEFTFKAEKKLTKFHTLGALTEIDRREVNPGDVIAINFQDKFIHQNHHHADLTVNLCFRTPDREGKRLSSFLYSGLKCEKDPVTLKSAERLYSYAMIDDFDFEKLNLSPEVSMTFLLETFQMSGHPRVQKIQNFLEQKLKKQFGLSVQNLLNIHDEKLDEITDG
jgi:hypothetical protein